MNTITTTNNILPKTKYQSQDSNPVSPDLVLLLTPQYYRSTFKLQNQGFYENSRFSTIQKLNFNDSSIVNIPRAGLIYFTLINGELFVCLGLDTKSGDITDFSGLRKKHEHPVTCALREGFEESRKVFGSIQEEQVSKFVCLYNSQMLIIFVPVISPVGTDIRKVTIENFNNKSFLTDRQADYRCYNEISEIVWYGEKELENMFSLKSNYKMYTKVRRFIYSCRPFSEKIAQMKAILQNGLISQETYELYQSQFNRVQSSKLSRKVFPRKKKFHLAKSSDTIDSGDSLNDETTITSMTTITNLTDAIVDSLKKSDEVVKNE